MKSIYVTDLDHTFLRTDHSISSYTKKVWNERAGESILTIATARSFSKSHEFLAGLRLDAPLILLDGAMVVSPDKEIIDLKLIERVLADAVIDAGVSFDIYPFVIGFSQSHFDEAFLYPRRVNPHQASVLSNYKNDTRLRESHPMRALEMNLKIVYFGEESQLRPLTEHLRATFGDALEYKLSPEKYSDGYFLTILHSESDKSHALQKVCDYMEREVGEVTVFGDSLNDIGMFDMAGTAVAVANALDEVKERANIILPHTNDEDAVAKYLSAL